MKKILAIFISFIFLSNCAQTAAIVGPAITVASTGNVVQAGYTFGSNVVVKETTGKTPGEHVSSYVEDQKEEKKIRNEMVSYLDSHIKKMRIKLSSKN